MAKDYVVQRIVELLRATDQGGIEKYYRHTIKTAQGTVLTVDIDERNFTPEKAAPLLQKAAQQADAIKSL